MINVKHYEVWFITGSQHLYGPDVLNQVEVHSNKIAMALDGDANIPVRVTFKAVLTTPEQILRLCNEANSSENSELLTRPPKFNVSRNISRELKLPSIFVYAVTVSLLP